MIEKSLSLTLVFITATLVSLGQSTMYILCNLICIHDVVKVPVSRNENENLPTVDKPFLLLKYQDEQIEGAGR